MLRMRELLLYSIYGSLSWVSPPAPTTNKNNRASKSSFKRERPAPRTGHAAAIAVCTPSGERTWREGRKGKPATPNHPTASQAALAMRRSETLGLCQKRLPGHLPFAHSPEGTDPRILPLRNRLPGIHILHDRLQTPRPRIPALFQRPHEPPL